MEAPDFIRRKLEEARRHLEIPSRSIEAASRPATSFVHGGKTISYNQVDETAGKIITAPTRSEPQSKLTIVTAPETSTLNAKLPNGVELFFKNGRRTSVSV